MAEVSWTVVQVRQFEEEIRSDPTIGVSGLNRMLKELQMMQTAQVKLRVALLYSIRRALAAVVTATPEDPELDNFIASFIEILGDGVLEHDADVANASLVAALMFAATKPGFWTRSFIPVLEIILAEPATTAPVRATLQSNFLARFADVRFWALEALTKYCQRATSTCQDLEQPTYRAMYTLLLACGSPTNAEEPVRTLELEVSHQGDKMAKRKRCNEADEKAVRALVKDHRKAWTECWLSFIATRLPNDVLENVLADISAQVLSRTAHPLRFADFLTESYNRSTLSSLLALEGLFTLISNHNLDYPLFYVKLYGVIGPDIFLLTNRARFLTLIPKFLLGKYLPEYLVAAFIKRFLRIAIHAPPHGAMWCLRLSQDLMRRHPSTYVLVHRVEGQPRGLLNFFDKGRENEPDVKPSNVPVGDPYRNDELDPRKSNATSSSLWELEALRQHYCPAVARMVEPFSRDIRRQGTKTPAAPPPGDVSDYANMDYSDLYEAEFRRRYTEIPLQYSAAAEVNSVIDWS